MPVDLVYLLCQTGPNEGNTHELVYRGAKAQSYFCRRCGVEFTKAALKEHTD